MQPKFEPNQGTKSSGVSPGDAFISAFIKAKRDLQLYPAGNATVTESIEKMLEQLRESHSTEEVAEILVEKDRLFFDGVEAGAADPRTREIGLLLFRRGVRKILIDPSIPIEEAKLLIGTLNLSVEQIAKHGGLEKLTKSRNIIHAAVEETAELMIFDGENLPTTGALTSGSLGDELGDELDDAQPDSGETYGRMFVRIQEGDGADIKRLQALLKKPSKFSNVLEKFAFQLEKAGEEKNLGAPVDNLLKMLRTVGTAVGSVPSEDERTEALQNLAVSVLDLSANVRTELISEGLVPNLGLKSVESEILSRFPIPHLAKALLENFQVSGATSSIMQSYFNDLAMPQTDKSALADTLKTELKGSGMLTTDLEKLLDFESGGTQLSVDEDGVIFPEHSALRVEYYPSERVLFSGNERSELMAAVTNELSEPIPHVMAASLLDLMRYESSAAHYAAFVGRAKSYMDYFLENGEYERAAIFLEGLQDELEQKKKVFSPVQLNPLSSLLEEYCGEQVVHQLAAAFRNIHGEGKDFEDLIQYFGVVGKPAVSFLMGLLEEEVSRHARLLICKALARTGEKNIVAIAENLKHPTWYVVRNAVSILGQTGSPACVPYLKAVLAHEDVRVRKEVLKALASIRSGEAVELLCSALEDEDPVVHKAALGWVAAIESEQALPMLHRILNGENIFKKDDEVLRLAVDALQAIATEPACELLERLRRTRNLLRPRKAAFIRELANSALEKIRGEHGHG